MVAREVGRDGLSEPWRSGGNGRSEQSRHLARRPVGHVAGGKLYAPPEVYRLKAHSFALFINRAPRYELLRAEAMVTSVTPADRAEPKEEDATPS